MAKLSPCLKALRKVEFKSDELEYLAKQISKQQSIQVVAWLLLTAHSETSEQSDDSG